jgi:hypothetical protein
MGNSYYFKPRYIKRYGVDSKDIVMGHSAHIIGKHCLGYTPHFSKRQIDE